MMFDTKKSLLKKCQSGMAIALAISVFLFGFPHTYAQPDSSQETVSVEEFGGPSSSQPESSNAAATSSSSSSSAPASSAAPKPDTSNLEAKLAQLKQQSATIQQNINKIKAEKSSEQAVYNEISSQISNVQAQVDIINQQLSTLNGNISSLEKQITELNATIVQKETDISNMQAAYDENYAAFQQRLVTLYMSGETSTLEVLLSSQDFSDLLSSTEYLRKIAERDQTTMTSLIDVKNSIILEKESMEAQKATVEANKTKIASEKKEVEAKKADQQQLKQSLASLQAESGQHINELNGEIAKEQLEKKLTDSEMAKIENEIQSLIHQNTDSNSTYIGGQLSWPLPGYYNISCAYNGYPGHTGMDITGGAKGVVNGQTIVAAGDGTVIATVHGNTGYGNYLMIDHGGGIVTLYAHCSSLSVSKGAKVSRGQAIATVGSTGNSSGPHLHFEVRKNGKHQNPIGYVKK